MSDFIHAEAECTDNSGKVHRIEKLLHIPGLLFLSDKERRKKIEAMMRPELDAEMARMRAAGEIPR